MAVINEYNMSTIYTAVLLSLFDNIQIKRRDALNPYTIPVTFGSKSRLYKRLYSEFVKDPSVIYQQQLPAISVDFNGIERNFDRQTNRMLKKKLVDIDGLSATVNWNDTAVDLPYTMTLIAKSMTEMTNIIEYIVSVFKNGLYYIDVKTPLYTDTISTPIVLETSDISIENNSEEYGDMRLLEATFDLKIKGILHNNVTSTNSKITKAMLNMYMDLQYQTIVQTYQVQG